MHESRHRHAMRRPRGPGGRFLTASEIAEMRSKQQSEGINTEGSEADASELKESS